MEDHNALGEQRFISLGTGATGELLVVVYTWRNDHVRLISARSATRTEQITYEKGISLQQGTPWCRGIRQGQDTHYHIPG
ncbi:MAG: BrnT family toxin [Gammaproteobacteria bacterium]